MLTVTILSLHTVPYVHSVTVILYHTPYHRLYYTASLTSQTQLFTITIYYHLSYFTFFFFFNDTATTEIYTLSLHDALPIFFKEHASHLHSPFYLPCRLPL